MQLLGSEISAPQFIVIQQYHIAEPVCNIMGAFAEIPTT